MVKKRWLQKGETVKNPYFGEGNAELWDDREILSVRRRGTPSPAPTPDIMQIPFTRHTLGNGLSVILHEDHDCPIVAVNLWYHVGLKNEVPGRTGFAHLFEHLMFEGSAHHDRGYFHPLQEAGALLNGSTSSDRTNYWEVVPTSAFELALWMESDRMGYLLPALTAAKFNNQRDVVLNERRQNYENRPYAWRRWQRWRRCIHRTIRTTGSLLDRLTICGRARWTRHMRSSRRDHHPANASLAIAGDIDPETGLALAETGLRRHSSRTSGRARRAGRDARFARTLVHVRIASSCRASTWRGIHPRCSSRAMPSSIS